jgi:hypothetical protein
MAVWLQGDLQTSAYWQEVQALANDLLDVSPLGDWTVQVRSKSEADAGEISDYQSGESEELWYVELDTGDKELIVGVPPEGDEEPDPEDAATYIVLDVLDRLVHPAD